MIIMIIVIVIIIMATAGEDGVTIGEEVGVDPPFVVVMVVGVDGEIIFKVVVEEEDETLSWSVSIIINVAISSSSSSSSSNSMEVVVILSILGEAASMVEEWQEEAVAVIVLSNIMNYWGHDEHERKRMRWNADMATLLLHWIRD
jgi:hypothetical protein